MDNRSLADWVTSFIRPTEGPGARRPLRLEPWQRGILDAIEHEGMTRIAIRAASQCGKTLCSGAVGLHAAVGGAGCLLASATQALVSDLRRRVNATLDGSPIGEEFAATGSGLAGTNRNMRETRAGGWLAFATAGSPAQLAARTVKVAIADELARWPDRVRSGEGHPLAILSARLADWGEDGRLVGISTPTTGHDAISLLWMDGDRRRLEYECPACGDLTPLLWDQVTGRERGETPAIACAACGVEHDEAARRRMLASARWVPQREQTDEETISFSLSRLDSGRSSLAQVCRSWRRAEAAAGRGDGLARMTWRNTVLGLPAQAGVADIDHLYDTRGAGWDDQADIEQVCAGVDVQVDRLVYAVVGYDAGSLHAWVLDYGDVLGDPTEDDVWVALTSTLTARRPGLPVSIVSVDAGYLAAHVRRQCSQRRWWIPTVGRAGEGKPIAKRMNESGVATLGKDEASTWWTGRVSAGRVRLPARMSRQEIAEACAAEALTVQAGRLRWAPIPGRPNHLWDAALLALHGRTFRPLGRRRGKLRLVPIGGGG